jgi:hypothetical protein
MRILQHTLNSGIQNRQNSLNDHVLAVVGNRHNADVTPQLDAFVNAARRITAHKA